MIDACRKADHETAKRDDSDNIVINIDKFFNVPASAPTVLKAIAGSMQKHNDTLKFADVLIKRAGYPRWDKAIVQTTKNKTHREQSGGDTTIVYLPFSFGTATSAVLTVAINVFSTRDTAYNIIYPQHYKVYGFDTTLPRQSWNARNVFQMFTEFDHSIFGTDSFAVNDGRIGGYEEKDQFLVKRKSTGWGTGRTNIFTYTCNSYVFHPRVVQRSAILPGSEFTITVCTAEYVGSGYNEGDPGPLSYPGNPIGGGGGGGNNNPAGLEDLTNIPVCPNTEQSAIVNPNPCDPAWHPLNGDPFADYENWGFNHLITDAISPEDSAAIQDWKLNNIDTTGLDPCVRGILDKLLSSDNNNMIGKLLAKMDGAIFKPNKIQKLKIRIQVGTTSDSGILGQTYPGHYNTTTHEYTDTIVIKDIHANMSTELIIAQTLTHEIVHAYMKLLFLTYYYNSFSPTQITSMNVENMFDIYVDSMIAIHTYKGLNNWKSGNPERDHNFMASTLLDKFAAGLARIDNNRNSAEYYWYIAWEGLSKSNTMLQYWPNYTAVPPNPTWPPSNPAPNDATTNGLSYALTQPRIDSIRKALFHEAYDTIHAKGRKRQSTGCY
jgi:hypothetical protein